MGEDKSGWNEGLKTQRLITKQTTNLVKTKVAAPECFKAWKTICRTASGTLGSHFLSRLVVVPSLALFLPIDESVDLLYSDRFADLAHVHSALEKSVHVQLTAFRAMAEEVENPF